MAATVSNANANRIVYMSDLHGGRPGFFAGWERLRHGKFHWLAESFAEAVCYTAMIVVEMYPDHRDRWVSSCSGYSSSMS
jgi:hypothetical protein